VNENELQDALKTLLEEIAFMDADDRERFDLPAEMAEVDRVSTFEEAGVLTRDTGLVVTATDGTEFQVTIIQAR